MAIKALFLSSLILISGIPAWAQDFVVTKGVEDIKTEIRTISLLDEASVQTVEDDPRLSLSFGVGSVSVPKQTYVGALGASGEYQEQARPQFSGRLTWLPLSVFTSGLSLGAALSIEYFSVEQDTLALHFLPLGLGPQLRVPLGRSVALNFGYDFINCYKEQVGLSEASGAEWFVDQRRRAGLDFSMALVGIGDEYSQYNFGVYYQETENLGSQSTLLQASVNL